MSDNILEMERIRAGRIARRNIPSNLENYAEENKCSVSNEEEVNIDKLLTDLKNKEPTSDNKFFRLAILTYEMGDLNKSIVYAMRFKEDEKAKSAYLANGKLALADILTQLYLLCISLKWDFNELRKLGVEHLKERQEEFKKQRWGEIK